jgi:hypothetical protein
LVQFVSPVFHLHCYWCVQSLAINVYPAIRTQTIPFRRRFNFKKANWELFATILDSEIQKCTLEDLWLANKKGFDVVQYWAKNL